MHLNQHIKLIFINLLFVLFMSTPSNAQEKTPEEKELERQAAIAESQKKIAEAKLAATKADKEAASLNDPISQKDEALRDKEIAVAEKEAALARRELFKGPEIAGNTGKITSTGDFVESRILALNMLSNSMTTLVTNMNNRDPFKNKIITLVVYNQADMPSIELYASMLDGLKSMSQAFGRANKATADAIAKPNPYDKEGFAMGDPLLLGYAASGILRTAADIVSLFRTTTEFKNFDMTIDDVTLVAALKKSLTTNNLSWKVFHPALYPVNTIKSNGATSGLMDVINTLQTQSTLANTRIGEVEAKIASIKILMEKETNAQRKARMQKHIDLFAPFAAELKSLNSSFAQLQTILTTVDTTTKVTAQGLLLRAERLFKKLNEDNVYTLKLTMQSKGSNKITENLWRNASIKHAAGVELSSMVFNGEGEIVFADVMSKYTPYTDSGNIPK